MDLSLSTRTDAPEHVFAGDVPLVAVERGGYVGSLHRGSAAMVTDGNQPLVTLGNDAERIFLRSAAKPFQIMPAIISGAVDRFNISVSELAVLCASHSGEQRHVDAVLSVLHKAGLDESFLRCGVHPPIDQRATEQRIRDGHRPSPVCNNCSGAHSGMLLACLANGWPLDDYGAPHHPLQRMTGAILAEFSGIHVDEIQYAVDNCAVPTFRVPLRRAALAFARLGTGSDVEQSLAEAAQRVRNAMTQYPEMVAGDQRFDTDLMRAGEGSILAKGGAEAFMGISLPRQRLGLAIKISDGNQRAIPPSVFRILDHAGTLSAEAKHELEGYRRPEQRDLLGRLVGHMNPVFRLGEEG